MILKCTSCNLLGNNFVEIKLKDCDDNPNILPDQLETVDIIDTDMVKRTFINMRLEGKNADTRESGFLVHPYIFRYDTVE